MDASDFFRVIQPATGQRCVAIPNPKGEGYIQFWGDTPEWVAEASQHLDQSRKANVYFAMSAFGDDMNAAGRRVRKQTNVVAVRSFWADVDCGPGKPYPLASEGAKAILAFTAKVGIGRPYLVSSGRGVHAYWPTDTDMSGGQWKFLAEIFKAAMLQEGLSADPSRTADASSVLRPPGTHHRKAEPKPVRIVLEGEVTPLDMFQEAMLAYAHLAPRQREDDILPEGGPANMFTGSNDDLTNGVVSNEPSDANQIADRCAIIGTIRDTKGAVDQPTWYHGLGVLMHTVQGDAICHEWSTGDTRYTAAETDRKLDQLRKLGPTTCRKLGENNPAACAACPARGTVTSPIQLGRGAVRVVERIVKTDKGFSTVRRVEDADPLKDSGFRAEIIGGKTMLQHRVMVEDPETGKKVETWEVFCDVSVEPKNRLWIEGVAYIECEMELRNNERRMFLLEGGTVGKGKDALMAELGRNEVIVRPNKAFQMDSYMKLWMSRLRDTADQVIAYRNFGWTAEKSFVMGDTVLHPEDGESRSILVSTAKSKAKFLEPKGRLDEWVRIIDRAYNAPGQEGYQFLVACGFAAPLLSMMRDVSGVTVYAHSEGSGAGKTTAQKAALSIWGDWNGLMLADKKATTNALWAMIGAYNSLPVVYDELTNQPVDVASDLVFSVSSGRGKERMRADGEMRENTSNWCTIMLASGNNLLSEKLAQHRANPEAEISRLFEYTLAVTGHLTPNEALDLFPRLMDNHGHAGRVFMRYVVSNYDAVQASLMTTRNRINEACGISQVERYWSALLACALVATSICRQLGLVQFDMKGLRTWMFDRLKENRGQREETVGEPMDLFGTCLSELWPGILVTNGEGDIRRTGGTATVVEKPRGTMVGRAIIPVAKGEQARLLLNEAAIRDWTTRKGVSAKEMFANLVKAGWADPAPIRYSLGRGTIEYAQTTTAVRAWVLYPAKFSASVLDIAQVVRHVVDGGNDAGTSAAGGTG